jgi:hypothetical protein
MRILSCHIKSDSSESRIRKPASPVLGIAVRLKIGGLALQLPFMELSESMGNHDSKIVGAASVD